MTPQIRLTWRLSINLGFTMQPLCPINTETKAYLPCSHQTTHSTFMSIITFATPHFSEKIGSVQSTNLNIQFVHIGTWAPLTFLFLLRERSIFLFAHHQYPSSLLTFKALPWVLFLSLSAFHFFLFVGYFLSAHSLYI